METFDVFWKCPQCGTENLDDYEFTAQPICSKCDHEPLWDDIMIEGQMTAYNQRLEERERGIV